METVITPLTNPTSQVEPIKLQNSTTDWLWRLIDVAECYK